MMIWQIVLWVALAGIFYGYVLYPVLMVLFANDGPPRPRVDGEFPSVSLIIPAYNEQAILEQKLNNATAIDYPRDQLEIIVASDGSSDATIEIAKRFEAQGVKVLAFTQRRGKASALNDAVKTAQGDILCLCDANVMFRPDALKLLVAHLENERVGAATGDVQLASHESNFGTGESLYYRMERRLQLGESRTGSLMGVDGGMYVVRKRLFKPLPPDTILDDFVITMNAIKAGSRVVYDPSAVATENGTPAAKQEYRRRVRVNAGAVQVLKRTQYPLPWRNPIESWQFFSHKVARWLSPVLFAAALIALIPLQWADGWIVHAYQAALGAALTLLAMAALATVSLRFRATQVGGICFYFVLSHIAMAEGLLRGLLNLQRVTWSRTGRTGESSNNSARPVSEVSS